MKHKVGVPVVAQVRRFLALSIKEHTDIKRDYRTRDSKCDEHAESCTKYQRRIYASVQRVPHVFHMLTSTQRTPWRVSAIEQESELLGHLNGSCRRQSAAELMDAQTGRHEKVHRLGHCVRTLAAMCVITHKSKGKHSGSGMSQ